MTDSEHMKNAERVTLLLKVLAPTPFYTCNHLRLSYVRAQLLSCLQLFTTLWTVAHRVPLFMGFSRQEYWSGLPFPSPLCVGECLSNSDFCSGVVTVECLWEA